jgi:hypothetical protein
LKELKQEGSLNTMHILLVYLQQSLIQQRPLAAALLLQLDLLVRIFFFIKMKIPNYINNLVLSNHGKSESTSIQILLGRTGAKLYYQLCNLNQSDTTTTKPLISNKLG